MFLTIEKGEALSASNLGFDVKSSDKSLMYIRNNKSPRIEIKVFFMKNSNIK